MKHFWSKDEPSMRATEICIYGYLNLLYPKIDK